MSAASSISKIHVTNSTGLSLNERFTAISSIAEPQENVRRRTRSRSRSRSRPRNLRPVDRQSSLANRRLLQQLAKRHKFQAALKLKRRSLRSAGGSIATKRGSIKALRVAPNGRPIRTNSLTNIATMKADLIANGSSRSIKNLRRAGSVSNIAGRLGSRRPVVGGAAQRVTKRRLQRANSTSNGQQQSSSRRPIVGVVRRGRSRSRSRVRVTEIAVAPVAKARGRPQSRGRSQSRGRIPNVRTRSRSRSRSRSVRGRNDAGAKAAPLPIKARLGLRPGSQNTATEERRNRRGGPIRRPSVSRRGVAQGRVQKRRNSTVAGGGGNGLVQQQRAGSAGRRVGRARGRSAVRNVAGRSQSRTGTRNAAVVGQQKSGTAVQGRRRGRSQQRNAGRGGAPQKNGKGGGKQETQQRRGRSRSRGARGGRGGRTLGKGARPQVNKESLDQELDQYMATTKTENDMDYLLKN